jgi:DNA polymerase elongation subunit (family B)
MYEYVCKLTQIKPIPSKETRVPYKICSFDIEASSSHGDFPVPIKTYKRLASNLVDVFQLQSAALNTKEMAMSFFQKIVYSAFGFSKCEDVDPIYPKYKPSKTDLQTMIDQLVQTTLNTANKINADSKSAVLTIESIFENAKKQHEFGAAAADEEEDGGNEGDAEDEPIQHGIPETKKRKTEKKPEITILDILLSDKYSREEKIEYTNEIMVSILPPVEGDKVTFIGSTFIRYGESEPYLNHCVVLDTCDPVPGSVIETCKTESDVLLKWTELIQRENPDIIIGYNIFGFDYEFMFRRAQENRCEREFLCLSRKTNELCGKEEMENGCPTGNILIENTKIQLATGEYDLRYFKMAGRLQIDMYTYFRRDFNLSSYKLDDVAGQFISDDVKKITHVENDSVYGPITELWTSNVVGLHAGDFIHIELTGFTTDYYKDGQKFRVLDIEMNRITDDSAKYNIIKLAGLEQIENLEKNKTIRWGMAKDDVTPQDIFRLTRGSSADRAIVAKYCIQDCNLVHHLMNKIDVITGYVEMSRICSVPISFLVFRGQGIKLTSYVAKKCREKNTLMPDLEKKGESEGYEGAIVLPPKCAMYIDNPVACVDYASLYPSSMISQNYSHDSKVWTREYNLNGELIKETGEKNEKGEYIYDHLPGYQYIDIEFDTYSYISQREGGRAIKTKTGRMLCRWAQLPDGQKSIMPMILEELLKARADTRKMIKSEKDPFMQNILDKRQLGYKVTANSLYGQCGSRTSTFYEKDVAACTTATGRMMITYAKRMIEEIYGDRIYDTICSGPVRCCAEYVYGDTDSVFFTFNLKDVNTGEKIRGKPALEMTIEIAQDVAALCSQFLKPPMDLTYEKTLMPFILLSKKRYVGTLYETNPNKGKLKIMGLSIKRRDSCDYLKDTYGAILNILMKEANISKAVEFLDDSIKQLIDGNVSMDKLAITKALRGDYKNPQQIAHRVLADRMGKRDPGNKPKPGDRMKFVFIQNPNKKALMGERIETPEYIIANKIKLDYQYYVTNQLMKPLQQLFGLALVPIWEKQGKKMAIKDYYKEIARLEKEFPDIEIRMKKIEKYCGTKIKTLLFDKHLNRIFNDANGMRTLMDCFGKNLGGKNLGGKNLGGKKL